MVAEKITNRESAVAVPNESVGDDLAVQPERELGGLRMAVVDLGLDAGSEGVDCVGVEHGS